ncbi:MAG TPA: preprotein translocase subunit SecE [Pyrinomonadaceae bacterium]|nr:preprotein translocase subunit SecE [Pyrinomonadaceae bacterium]
MAEKLDDVNVSEEEFELETEAASAQAPEAPGGEPPKKTKRGTLPPGGGGRGGKQRATTPGFFARTGQFIRDTRAEMRRVTWPSATEVKNTTIITLIAVIFFALYLFGVDRVWAFAIDHLRTWLGG